ncbi:hypothetical protein LCGC14_1308280 [marine sediment metagenome]|uniref:Uncharacterized protein n=1 Tax=marine sediment metagenome TaxID=412755 RepID=A0A0F9NQJ8_9ZZZZ
MASANDVYPDGENLLARINEIQEIIVTTSKALPTPAGNVDNLPMWLTIIRTIVPVRGVQRQYLWPFQVEMVLFRSTIAVAAKNPGIINQINLDLINTLTQFGLRKNLQTPTFPTTPDGFEPDSVRIQGEGYSEHTETGFAGSTYTMQFSYEIFESISAIEGID